MSKKQKFTIGTGLFDRDTMTFSMGKDKVYSVQSKEEKVKYKEREDAGGGCYWGNHFVWTESTRITYTVWDNENYIGRIVDGSSVKFRDPQRHQIELPINPNQ